MPRSAQVGRPERVHLGGPKGGLPVTNWLEALAGDEPLFLPKERRRKQPFLKGPVPLPWLQMACRLRAGSLAIYIWWKVGLLGRGSKISLRPGELSKFGLGPRAIRRQYKALVGAKLVCAVLEAGKCKAVRVN